jgi:iron complex outermembrane recepter protein
MLLSRPRAPLAPGVILLLLWTAEAAATPEPGDLTGTVRNALNAPLAEVTITLRGPASQVARTDSDGRFVIRGLPEGDYELVATLAEFAPARLAVRLTSGERTIVSLTLTVQLQEQTFVTATKTGEHDVQTTPMAVSVLTGADLQRAEANSVADLARVAPSVTFSQNSDFAQLTIRGIGSNVVFAGTDPSSAVYVDGVYMSRPVLVLADFLELERVEVLRGPQGTLYGRNAVGGAINLVTKPPTNTLEASARFVAGNLGTFRSEARLSGPVVPGRVLGSAAILRGVREGFVRDVDHPDHPLGGEDVTAVRGKLQFIFNRRSNLLVSGDITHQDPIPLTYAKVLAVKPGFQVDNPADLHEVRASTLAEGRILQYGGAARFTATLPGSTTLTSTTAFRKLEYDIVNDADITELNLTAVHLRELQHQWSEEVTFTQQRHRVTWIAGLFFFDEADRQPTSITLGGPRLENRLNPNVEADTEAVFGQVTIDMTSRLSATAGLRYSREHKTIDNAGQLSTLDLPVTLVAGTAYSYTDAISHTAWTPKFGVEIRARQNAFAYVSATRGFKSGGFNFTSLEAGRGYAPEWAWSYEGGLKTIIAGGRANINVAAFHTDYADLQVQTAIRPGVIDISNAAEATIRGFELEGTTRVTQGLHAGGHLAWLAATYDRYVAVGVGGVTGDVADNRLTNAPEWSGRVWLQWSGNLGRAGLVSLRAESRLQSTVFFTPFNDRIQQQGPYGLVDGSAEFGPKRRHWSITAWARNLTNADYITGTFSTPIPAIGGRPGLPRQVGVQLTLRP